MYMCYTLDNNKNLPCPLFSPLKRGGSLTVFLLCYLHISELEKLCQLKHEVSEQETNL